MLRTAALLFFALIAGAGARADEADFFRGRTITLSIGTGPGGGYDAYGRLIARHLGKHIPGAPAVIVQNVPGASSLVLTNQLYNKAARDGTQIAVINQAMPLEQALGMDAVAFDANRFNWLGRMTSVIELGIVWHTSPVRTFEDTLTRETIMGAAGPASTTSIIPQVLNTLVGTKHRVITGFRSNTEVLLGLERGEVEGTAILLEGVKTLRADWVREKKFRVLSIWSNTRTPEYPDAPSLPELGRDDETKRLLRFFGAAGDIGRGVVTPPDVPVERVNMMRRAFDAAMADPGLREDAQRAGLDLKPLRGDEYQAMIAEVATFPKHLAAKARAAREAAR